MKAKQENILDALQEKSFNNQALEIGDQGTIISKVPKLFGRISGDIILFVSS